MKMDPHDHMTGQETKIAVYTNRTILDKCVALVDPQPDDILLDIGKNRGTTAAAFVNKVSKVVILDDRYSKDLIQQNINRILIDSAKNKNIEIFSPFDLTKNLPFDDNTFSIVTARAIFNQIDKIDCFIKDVYRILKPGGKLDVWVPILSESIKQIWSLVSQIIHSTNSREYTYLELMSILSSARFEIAKVIPITIPRSLAEKLSVVENEVIKKRIETALLSNKDLFHELDFRWVSTPSELGIDQEKGFSPGWFHSYNTIEILAYKS